MKTLAVIGSSGGNLFYQGGSDPKQMIGELNMQASGAKIKIGFIQYILASKTMDNISSDTKAQLISLGEKDALITSAWSNLSEINQMAKKSDDHLAGMIMDGVIEGLILLSCDPEGVNKMALKAASVMNIPVVGTGGTSMAQVQALGCKVIATSGTTGTTNRTRAVTSISAFAKEWGLKYRPVIGATTTAEQGLADFWQRISIRGIMMAAMPAFIALSLTAALIRIPMFEQFSPFFTLMGYALPVVIAAIGAKQVSGLDEIGIISGIIAGILLGEGGIIGGLIVGIIAGLAAGWIISLTGRFQVPGTTANIAAGAISGVGAGIFGFVLITPWSVQLADWIRSLLNLAVADYGLITGAFLGFIIWYAIIKGIYHAVILPLILLEMEATGFSFVGCIDMICLVMVCAGIQLGQIIKPRKQFEREVSRRNILVNLAFGTYVEAAYPYILTNRKMYAGTIGAATLAGMTVGYLGIKSTAYVPVLLAPLLTNINKSGSMVVAMVIALLGTALITIIINIGDKNNDCTQ